jgi:hypothetical protein
LQPNQPAQSGVIVGTTAPVTAVHGSLNQEVVITTVDKLRLALRDHMDRVERTKSWIAPLGLFAALLVVFPTTDFKPFGGLSADVWKAIFVIGTFAATLWLCVSLWRAFTSMSVDDVVEIIKKSSP